MVTPNYPQNQGKPPGQPREPILFVHPEKNEQLWDIYVWRFNQNYGTREPSVVSLSSKRHQDRSLDMKIVFTYLPTKHQSVWDWKNLPYHRYVRDKALLIMEVGTEGLEKRYVEGQEQ